MSMNDPIADMLTRIRNAQMASHKSLRCPWSTHKERILAVLKDEGYIRAYKVLDLEHNKKDLEVELKYNDGEGAIREVTRISKPGRRQYFAANDLPSVYNGLGILIVSTPHGVMTDHTARRENVGGEVICKVF
ncbi:MAG: 30S ribosomal protein S8 [Rhodospirillales bacterium]|nr:30S ribosomal protein S8 [Rhodospirillales bacterium]